MGLNQFTKESLSSDVSSVLIEAKILKLISSIFVSTEVLWSLFHVAVMLVFGSLMERVRGTYCLLMFVIEICLISELLTLVTFLSLYYFTFDTFYLERRVCGFDAMIGAFIVCITEVSPDRVVVPNLNMLTFQVECVYNDRRDNNDYVQYLPFSLVVTVMTLHFIGLLGITQTLLICSGTWIGWGILRYFAPSIHNEYEKGNASDEFELQYLFPPILRFPVRTIGNITFAIFKNVGCCETPSISKRTKSMENRTDHSEDLNDLVLNLSAQKSEDVGDDTNEFAKLVMNNKYSNSDANDIEAKKRQEAKNLIEKRLQQIQKEYNQRIITNQSKDNDS